MSEVLVETAEETIARLVHRVKELEAERNTVFCAFCGFLSERPSEPGEITVLMASHIASCEKHPLNKAVKENDRLRKLGLALLDKWLYEARETSLWVDGELDAEYERRKKEWESCC